MTIKRKKFTAAEKARIALEAIKAVLTIVQIRSCYDVHPTQISAWKKQALLYLPDAFGDRASRYKESHEQELAEL